MKRALVVNIHHFKKHIMQPAYHPPTHPQQAKMATYTALLGMFGSFFFFEPRPAGGL